MSMSSCESTAPSETTNIKQELVQFEKYEQPLSLKPWPCLTTLIVVSTMSCGNKQKDHWSQKNLPREVLTIIGFLAYLDTTWYIYYHHEP
jgi:hypothetical protein